MPACPEKLHGAPNGSYVKLSDAIAGVSKLASGTLWAVAILAAKNGTMKSATSMTAEVFPLNGIFFIMRMRRLTIEQLLRLSQCLELEVIAMSSRSQS